MRWQTESGLDCLQFDKLSRFPQVTHGVFLEAAKLPLNRPKQVHGVEISVLPHAPLETADASMTQEKGVPLSVLHADCQAALFYDPVTNTIGSVHAGWRGNVQNFYGIFVKRLQQEFGVRPEDLIVCLAPSLGPCCAEFKNYHLEFPEVLWGFQVRPFYFDLWAVARHQLTEAGVRIDNIEFAHICTLCHPKGLHSYRRDKTTRRLVSTIAITG